MNFLVYGIYTVIVGLIRFYKRIRLQVLLLFNPFLKEKGTSFANSIGVTLHFPKDKAGKLTEKLQICRGNYEQSIQLQVHDNKFFARVANLGTLGFGEEYMDKNIEVNNPEDLTEIVRRVLETRKLLNLYYHPWNRFLEWLELYAFNLQTRKRAVQVGKEHYDLGNDLYELMLDPWMQYTCAYWKNADNLNDAQIAKMELIAKKLDVKPGMRVLDIGCGFGSLCTYLAKNYGVNCVGVTISTEQAAYGNKISAGLPVKIRVQDYREITERFDRVVSIGCLEHVGYWNYRDFFQTIRRCLVDDDGVALVHSIGCNLYNTNPCKSDPWTNKFIFPNAQLPSPIDITIATKDLFVIEDWHNFGLDYAKTLFAWRENFMKSWPQIKHKYDERFYRMWICYLSLARATFLSRRFHLWQIVLSKDGLKRDYRAAR